MVSLFVLLVALAAQSGEEGKGAGLVFLDQYRWKHRLIIVFAPSPEDPSYREQQTSFEQTEKMDLAERDLLIFSCFDSRGAVERYGPESALQAFGASAADILRSTFGVVPEEFQVLLVGKDGGEKRRSSVPVAAEDFLAQIDSMPMRQQEMRE
jgi:hypothetical protein